MLTEQTFDSMTDINVYHYDWLGIELKINTPEIA